MSHKKGTLYKTTKGGCFYHLTKGIKYDNQRVVRSKQRKI